MPSRVEQFQALVAQQPANELFHFSLAQALVAENRAEEYRALRILRDEKSELDDARILLGKLLL